MGTYGYIWIQTKLPKSIHGGKREAKRANPKPIYPLRSKNPRKTRENGEMPDDRYFNSREKKAKKHPPPTPPPPPLPPRPPSAVG